MYILWLSAGGTLDHFSKNEDGYCNRVIQGASRQHFTVQNTSQTPVSKKSVQPTTTGHHGNTEEKREQRKKAVTHSGGESDYFNSTNMLQHLHPKSTYTNKRHQQLQEQVLTYEGNMRAARLINTRKQGQSDGEREASPWESPMKKQQPHVPPKPGGGGGHNSQAWPGLTWWAPLQDWALQQGNLGWFGPGRGVVNPPGRRWEWGDPSMNFYQSTFRGREAGREWSVWVWVRVQQELWAVQRSHPVIFHNGHISKWQHFIIACRLVLCQRMKLAAGKRRWLTWHWRWCRWCTQSLLSRDSGMWRSWFSSRSTLQIWSEIETWPTRLGLSFSPPVDESDSAKCNWSSRSKNDAKNSTKPTKTFPGTVLTFFYNEGKECFKKTNHLQP